MAVPNGRGEFLERFFTNHLHQHSGGGLGKSTSAAVWVIGVQTLGLQSLAFQTSLPGNSIPGKSPACLGKLRKGTEKWHKYGPKALLTRTRHAAPGGYAVPGTSSGPSPGLKTASALSKSIGRSQNFFSCEVGLSGRRTTGQSGKPLKLARRRVPTTKLLPSICPRPRRRPT